MTILSFERLPEEAKNIREEVFVKEQGFFEEFDDKDDIATHFVALECGKPVGTCRLLKGADGEYLIGRIAVVKSQRGRCVGAGLVAFAEKVASERGGKLAVIHAQTRARAFYEKQGYAVFGEEDDEEGVPHIWMRKPL